MSVPAIIGSLLGMVVGIVSSAIWSGYVLSVLWGWFVVPTFHLPQLPLTTAIGISLIVRLLTFKIDFTDDYTPVGEKVKKVVYYSITVPLISLSIGWVVRAFM